jgi:uncharacterized repeat protein (TIGR01451 family)
VNVNDSSNPRIWFRRVTRSAGAAALVALLGVTIAAPWAGADTQSDPRATFFSGNVTSCAGIGLPNDTQVGADNAGSASDGVVSGVVKTNAGSVQPGVGQEVDITATAAAAVDAVVVKGANGYNVYSNAAFLPPALQPDQHYIAPLNGGGNVPAVSHWFVCYQPVQLPALSIVKTADAASVSAGSPIGFTVTVSNSGAAGTGTATAVTISDPLPGHAGVSWSISPAYPGPGTCSITGTAPTQTLGCSLGDLAPGASASVHVHSGTTVWSAGTYPNTATASATNSPKVQASATTKVLPVVKLFIGYADGLRTSPHTTPGTPWEGSPNTKFIGCPNDICTNGPHVYDGGAILIQNYGKSILTVANAHVVIGGCTFNPWGSNRTIPAAVGTTPGSLVLTETKGTAPQGHQAGCKGNPAPTPGDNFDTSDTYPTACQGTANDGLVPAITVTLSSHTRTFKDTKQLLNSHGRDSGCNGADETEPWALLSTWTQG